jgi:putative ABC transport system permease protein
LLEADTFAVRAERFGAVIWGGASELTVSGWSVSVRDASVFVCMAAAVAAGGWLLHAFFRTRLGTAMRATGDNDRMVTALGVNVDAMRVLGLALSNGLVGLSGALLAQYQGFADVQMGIGMMVWGMASVIIGEALTGASPLALQVAGAVIGSVLFRLLVAVALRWGLNPNDLKLITAGFVFVALVSPAVVRRLQSRRPSQQGGPRA